MKRMAYKKRTTIAMGVSFLYMCIKDKAIKRNLTVLIASALVKLILPEI